MRTFHLEILTQEKPVLTETVDSLTVTTDGGQITVLANHQPLFARLQPGELAYTKNNRSKHYAVTGGFIDVGPDQVVTILADAALRSDEINLLETQRAIENAKKALESAPDQKTKLNIELELRQSLVKERVASRYRQS